MPECNGKMHDFKEIYSGRASYEHVDVVRWCQGCGAIVIDIDFDNRTNPGAVMPMRFPKVLNEKAKT